MMNLLAKALVLVHTVLCIMGMGWAIMIFLQERDYGYMEPFRDVLKWTQDGKVESAVLYPSEYDKSVAAVIDAGRTRDRTYWQVKPAVDSIRAAEPHLPANHLFYRAELERLRNSKDPIEVKRLKGAGIVLDPKEGTFGKPVPEDKALDMITKSQIVYQDDLKKLFKDIDAVDEEIRKTVETTKKITGELTGTDDLNKYIQPGLYQLIDLEFRSQAQIKIETDEIKPYWSKAVEQSRLFQYRRADLEATLQKLQRAAPAPKKVDPK